MLRSRLNVILAERDLRQDQISTDTGISKVTISNIVNNKTNGFQYETLNELAKYLEITPSDLFEFYNQDIMLHTNKNPLDISDYSETVSTDFSDPFNPVKHENRFKFVLEGAKYDLSKTRNVHFTSPLSIEVLDIQSALNDELEVVGTNSVGLISFFEEPISNEPLKSFISSLPVAFRQTIINMFKYFVQNNVFTHKEIPNGTYSVSLEERLWFTVEKD